MVRLEAHRLPYGPDDTLSRMGPSVVLSIALAMQPAPTAEPPRILQIYRDFVKPGADDAYRSIEEDAARICARLKCPNPYLAIESLTGPKEVWYFNGYRSAAHEKAVADGYRNNTALMAALGEILRRKADLILKPVEARAEYRPGSGGAAPWRLGDGRFLAITIRKAAEQASGTAFVSEDGTQFVIVAARTHEEADAKAGAAGPDARVFAVSPGMSMPAPQWIASDPYFWRPTQR